MQITCIECGEHHPPLATFGCDTCGGLLTITYDDPLNPERIRAGRSLFERYGERLPSEGSAAGVEGDTPLIRADALAAELGIEATVYLKDERRNPTGSFKDRGLAPAVSLASEQGASAVLAASTGNAAAATAHYAARAGLECYLLVEASAPAGKLVEPRAYGARTVRVEGLFDGGEADLAALLGELATVLEAHLVFSYRPFNPTVAEGVKTISYETAEALGWAAPEVVITATGGGDNLWAQYRGYQELEGAGLVDDTPRLVAAQAAGAAPIVEAIESGADRTPTLDAVDTVASGISAPFGGSHAIQAIRASGGTAVGVTDDELLDGEAVTAATTGVWAEPASATVIPALERLATGGWIDPDETVVLTITGSGYKHTAPFLDRLPSIPTTARDVQAVANALDR